MSRFARGLPLLALLLAVACDRAPTTHGSPETPVAERSSGGAADTTPAVASSPALSRIVFLGDSLTAGLGIGKDQAVPALIQERLRREGYAYDVVNAGNSGDTSDGGLSRLDWSLAGNVAILVVELGANDGLRGISPARTRQNLESIVGTAKQRGITVLLTGMEAPPNYGPAYTAEFHRAFPDLAREHGVTFMPFYLTGVAGIPDLNQADGIHPNPAGARIVEANMWRALQPMLGRTRS
jgi:acyl-CoA thioesterase-1